MTSEDTKAQTPFATAPAVAVAPPAGAGRNSCVVLGASRASFLGPLFGLTKKIAHCGLEARICSQDTRVAFNYEHRSTKTILEPGSVCRGRRVWPAAARAGGRDLSRHRPAGGSVLNPVDSRAGKLYCSRCRNDPARHFHCDVLIH
jgi:hypothetical protein